MLEALALSRQAANGQYLLRDFSLSLAAGECLGLSGPSGCGKTVLLRALAGLDPLSSGDIRLWGQQPTDLPHYRSQVMYLPQKAVFVSGTVQDNLNLPLRFKIYRQHLFLRQHAGRQPDWQALGLSANFATREISRLSGGEQQKLALLRALQLEPQILLLDEPTAAMDPESTRQSEQLISQWLSGSQRACIWVSHQPEQLKRVATRRLALSVRLQEAL